MYLLYLGAIWSKDVSILQYVLTGRELRRQRCLLLYEDPTLYHIVSISTERLVIYYSVLCIYCLGANGMRVHSAIGNACLSIWLHIADVSIIVIEVFRVCV